LGGTEAHGENTEFHRGNDGWVSQRRTEKTQSFTEKMMVGWHGGARSFTEKLIIKPTYIKTDFKSAGRQANAAGAGKY